MPMPVVVGETARIRRDMGAIRRPHRFGLWRRLLGESGEYSNISKLRKASRPKVCLTNVYSGL